MSYNDETMDRHRRWSALLYAGFSTRELMTMRPFVFDWSQIVKFAPGAVIWSYCRGMKE